MIDVCNQHGGDKLLFSERIQWVKDRMDTLEDYIDSADNKPLYIKGVMAIRKAQQKMPTGHLVGFDATCSGIQVMSALTGCKAGAEATGLVNSNVRADAYSTCTKIMNDILGGVGLTVERKRAKQALMTVMYGSKAEPIKLFGEDTPELKAFYEAANTVAPGAWSLLQDLLQSWQAGALKHEWVLPDGFEAKIKVMQAKETRIEVDELDGASFTYQYYVNEGTQKGLSNAANVVHSVDAYVLRCIHRRCNYDSSVINAAKEAIDLALYNRFNHQSIQTKASETIQYYIDLYEASGMADVVVAPFINHETVEQFPTEMLEKLLGVIHSMVSHKPFAVVTVHDEFKCHPNYMNYLRQHYINVFAELADSTVLDLILGQIYGVQGTYNKLSNDLSELIRSSNYALC
jgi:hypothetical protein